MEKQKVYDIFLGLGAIWFIVGFLIYKNPAVWPLGCARAQMNVPKDRESLKMLSERRILDILVELETVGLISTWNVSRGRGGFGKEIKLNSDPSDVADIFRKGSEELGFYIKITRSS